MVALDAGDDRLGGLAHERMTVSTSGLAIPAALAPALESPADGDPDVPPDVLAGLHLPASFDLAQHFVSAAAGLDPTDRPGWRARLHQLLDLVSGPAPAPGATRRAQ